MIYEASLKDTINKSFSCYAGAVLADRALCDARDMLKPSARMLIYSQLKITKNTFDKPFIKSARVVGDCLGRFYYHGDQSCYGTYMRMAKPFAMRIPLENCQGNSGTIIATGDEASMRYTELRLAEISQYLYSGLDKNAIGKEWRDNFDETEQFPAVMPSIGFYNIVNGTIGLGIALSSSIPSFPLKDTNEAIIKLIKNPDLDARDVVVLPDFATGGFLMNADEVKEALIVGTGHSCHLRAKISYDLKTNSILVSELPYNVYSSTVVEELKGMLEREPNCGIEEVNDASGIHPELTISLRKGINVKKFIKKLYKETSLDNYFPINMWALENGRYPKIFGLKDFYLTYISHIRTCKRRETQFDLDKALARQNIVEGLIKASASIDDIVAIIRASANPADAQSALMLTYSFNDEQAKAILAMKLSSLTRIDAVKLNDEMAELTDKIQELEDILNYPEKLDAELIKVLQEVADKFGDERRTVILNEVAEEEEDENEEEKQVCVFVFSNNEVRVSNPDEIASAKKGRKGKPIPTPRGATLVDTLYSSNLANFYAITKTGKIYAFPIENIVEDVDISLYQMGLGADEEVVKIFASDGLELSKYLVFATKSGMVKRTETAEYKSCFNRGGIAAIKLREDDEIISCFCSSNDEDIVYMATTNGFIVRFKIAQVSITGRVSLGVKGIKEGEVVSAGCVYAGKSYKGFLSLSSAGKGKISAIDTVPLTNRAVKGVSLQKIDAGDELVCVEVVEDGEKEIKLLAGNKVVSLPLEEIASRGRVATGSKLIDIQGKKVKITVLRR